MVDQVESLKKGDKIYLVHAEENKFWEVWNLGSNNRFRYGRWDNGNERKVVEGTRNYQNNEDAINRALEICMLKCDKGYLVVKSENTERGKVFNRFTSLIYNSPRKDEKIVIELD